MKRSLAAAGPLILALFLLGCGEAGGEVPRPSGAETDPILSPDGTYLAYGRSDASPFHGLYVSRPDGTQPRVLYRDSGLVLPLEWTPDGRYILTRISWPGRPARLLLVSLEGSLRLIPEPERTDL